jgi:hypothetical protein
MPHTLVESVRAAGFPRAEITAQYGGSRVVVHAEKGPRSAGRHLVEDLVLSVDRPRAGEVLDAAFDVSGWALSQLTPARGIETIRVALDDPDALSADLGVLEYRRSRPDLQREFGPTYGASGFAGRVTRPDMPPGDHMLYVVADGPGGWNYRAIPVKIESPV